MSIAKEITNLTDFKKYKKGELNKLRSWAKDEIREWQVFLDKVEEEYNKR